MPRNPHENLLLARLPKADLDRLMALLRPVELPFKHVLYRQHEPIEYAYFPTSGVASAVLVMENAAQIEVSTIGREGMVGQGLLMYENRSPHEVAMQVGGEGYRISAHDLLREASSDGPLRRLLLRLNAAVVSQMAHTVACNGLHNVEQRCCRWLLMTLDRVSSNIVPLTHEYLAVMLGVRRASVSEVLRPLHTRGLIDNRRGEIEVLDREGLEKLSCECYRRVKEQYERLLGEQ
jgi:CRP-like cAMP-binding protein